MATSVFGAFLAGFSIGNASEYTIEGNLSYSVYDRHRVEEYNLKSSFRSSVRNQFWSLSNHFDSDTKKGRLDGSENAGFDGTNVFYVLNSAKHPGAETNSPGVAFITEDGNFPAVLSAYSRVIWLATLSSSHFATGTNGDMSSPWLGEGMAPPVRFNVEETMAGTGLPKTVIFTTTAKIAIVDWDQQKVTGNYETNWVVARLITVAATNLNGLVLPMDFELVRYGVPKFDREIEECQTPLNIYRGKVTSVRAVGPVEVLPKLERRTLVQDGRYRDKRGKVRSINYTISNGIWPTRDDPELVALLRQELRK